MSTARRPSSVGQWWQQLKGPTHQDAQQEYHHVSEWISPITASAQSQAVQFSVGGSPDELQMFATTSAYQVDLTQPVLLDPVAIAKPWGQEIWYTGMEPRGESQARVGTINVPLSEYLALAPELICGDRVPVLLKILDPKADSSSGDLYFEVHQHKQEVYVVTHIDPDAWPDGRGAIRLGMAQDVRATFDVDGDFRQAYLQAVQDYEQVRRTLDEPSNLEQRESDQPRLELLEQERSKRAHMESFTALRQLQVGDVVTVQPWYPHSLQHGVRVVELQTPTYERYIISFAQRVLTQDHWDSATAIATMSLAAPPEQADTKLALAQIADFSDFAAWRVTLAPGESLTLPTQQSYALCIAITGQTSLGPLILDPEAAALIPCVALPCVLHNQTALPATLVIGGPPDLKPGSISPSHEH